MNQFSDHYKSQFDAEFLTEPVDQQLRRICNEIAKLNRGIRRLEDLIQQHQQEIESLEAEKTTMHSCLDEAREIAAQEKQP